MFRFSSLTPKVRQIVLTSRCPDFVLMLVELVKSICPNGGCCYIYKNGDTDDIKETPRSLNPSKLKVCHRGFLDENEKLEDKKQNDFPEETRIYSAIRFFSSGNELDSITVTPFLVEDVGRLRKFLETQSNSRYFKSYGLSKSNNVEEGRAKKLVEEAGLGLNCDDYPTWFLEQQANLIFSWVAAYIEFQLMSLFTVSKRKETEVFMSNDLCNCLSYQKKISNFWCKLTQKEKIQV